MKKITALIVTYNRLRFLKESIDAVLKQSYKISHLIIINNNSDDGTYEYLNSLNIDNAIIKHLDHNIGGSGGFFEGIKIFEETLDDDYVWLMDDDTIPNSDSLLELSKCWNKVGKFGFLASNVRWTDGKPAVMNIPSVDKDHWDNDLLLDKNEIYLRIVSASFVSLLIPRDVVFVEGFPYKEFFIWEDDAEYTSRISKNFECYFVPKSIVIHKMKSNNTADIVNDDGSRLNRYFYQFRNKTFRARKEHGEEKIKHFGRIGVEYGKVIFGRGIDSRLNKIKVMSKGIAKGIIFNPKIKYADKRGDRK